MTKPRVIFFGNERLATGISSTNAPLLNGLIENGYPVVAVVARHSTVRSRKQPPLEVAEIAKAHDIPFLAEPPEAITSQLAALQPDIAVLAAYGHIISQAVIDLFPKGILNIHPSLLPRYRGSSPIEAAILNGDSTTGVSLMQLTSGMDEGPVYGQVRVEISADESKRRLHDQLAVAGAQLLLESLPAITAGQLEPTPQNDTQASYTRRLAKSDGVIDWQQPAKIIERQIRAYLDWPGSHTTLGEVELVITAASVAADSVAASPGTVKLDGRQLSVATGSGSLLIESVKPAGKKEMPLAAFLAGYQNRLGV